MLRATAVAFCLCFAALQAHAQADQTYVLSGAIVEAGGAAPLAGVNVVLISRADSTRRVGAISDVQGAFRFDGLAAGSYQFQASHVGFKRWDMVVFIFDADKDLGAIPLTRGVTALDEVLVEERQIRVEVKGDTTEYHADAFKVNPDASAEDLIAKMPGIVVEDGAVMAHGEDVEKVLVDGREFFGDDPTLALRNLPAEIIEKIQVFDRLSDQAEFTGFNDGNTQKTINIITRPGRNNGQFGKAFSGYGTDDRYRAGGNVNVFNDDQRLSLIGLSNNISQQNFTTEDLLGVVGTVGRRRSGLGGDFRGGGGGRGRGSGGGRGGGDGRGGGRFGGPGGGRGLRSDPSNFLVGPQGGLSTTNAIGLNFNDQWGTNMRVNGSYFFNNSKNVSNTLLDRQYILSDEQTQFYNESNNAESDNFNHRFNARIQYTIDEANSLIITPRLSFQSNNAVSFLQGVNALADAAVLSQTANDYIADNTGYTSSSNILYRHRFARQGRTFSINVGLGFNDRSGKSSLFSTNEIFAAADSSLVYDQQIDNALNGYTLSTNLTYTEPVGERGMVQFTYRPSLSKNDSDKETYQFDALTGAYSILDPALSNAFENDVVTHRGGASYRLRGEKYNVMVGVNYQQVRLSGDQSFPSSFATDRTFHNVLPSAMLQYRFSPSNNLRLFYRTSTNTPSISQLQGVIDNTNPLILSSGNPDLKQSYRHTFLARYGKTDRKTGRILIGYVSASQSRDYIGTASFFAETDTLLQQSVLLLQGSQLSTPVNLNGYWNVRSFFTLGLPVDALKSNLNMNAGLTYTRTPGRINDEENIANIYNLNGGIVLGSNISERVDFTLSAAANYNIVSNTIFPELDGNYLVQLTSAKATWLPWQNLVLDTNLGLSQYAGLGGEFDQSIVLWNAGVGYKFLKGNAGEVKLMIADILNQNNSISRTVNEFYIEDNQTQVLGRYVMLNFTYRLKNFRL